jgi:tetratricopeptide (TPR) repeat protein
MDPADNASPAVLAGMTRAGDVVGTPLYIAPELWGAGRATAASDQWSFCVSLYEALAGTPPFSAEVLEGMAKGTPPAAPPPPPGAPRWLARVVLRGLARDPAARHPSMEALLRELGRDPGRTARRALVAGAAALALAAAGFGAASLGRGPACRSGAELFAGAWDPPARARLERAFAASGGPGAAEAFGRIAARLDAWTGRFAEASEAACRARAEPLADRRSLCVEELRGQLETTVSVLTENVSSRTLDAAASAVSALGDPAACSDARALAQREPPPADPGLRARAAAMLHSVDEIITLHAFKSSTSIPQIERLMPEIRAFPLPHVRLHGLWAYGAMLNSAGRFADARRALEEQIGGAAVAHDDLEAARGWMEILNTLVFLHRWEEILAVSLAANAAADRAVAPPSFRGHVAFKVAVAHKEKGELEQAELDAIRAVGLIEGDLGHRPDRLANVLGTLADVRALRGDLAGATAIQRRRVAALESVFGPTSGWTASARMQLAEVLLRAGDAAGAETELAATVAVYRARFGDDHHGLGYALSLWAECAERRGAIAEARGALDEAAAIGEDEGARMELPRILDRYGHFLLRRGDLVGARAKIDRGRALREEMFGAASGATTDSVMSQGDLALAEGRGADALALYRDAAERNAGKDAARAARALTGEGEALLHLGRAAEALAPLERARALPPPDPRRDWLHARARWEAKRDAAAEADARAARAALARAGDSETVAAIDAWLQKSR